MWPCDFGSPRGWPNARAVGEPPPSGARGAIYPCPPPPPLRHTLCECSRSCVPRRMVSSAVTVGVFSPPDHGRTFVRWELLHAVGPCAARTPMNSVSSLPEGHYSLGLAPPHAVRRPLVGLMYSCGAPSGFWGPLPGSLAPEPHPCRGEQGPPTPRAGSALWMRPNLAALPVRGL